jgi:hypothetical protein
MKAKTTSFDEDGLNEAANLGLNVMSEFLKSSRGIGAEAFERLKEQAKVGCVAVATKVRYEAAKNNREALALMRNRQISAPAELLERA